MQCERESIEDLNLKKWKLYRITLDKPLGSNCEILQSKTYIKYYNKNNINSVQKWHKDVLD